MVGEIGYYPVIYPIANPNVIPRQAQNKDLIKKFIGLYL
jgi:hypothetical protein